MAQQAEFEVTTDRDVLLISLLSVNLSLNAIADLASTIATADQCHAALIRSTNEDFCLGRAPSTGPPAATADDIRTTVIDPILQLYRTCQRAPQSIVTAVHGRAHGLGFGLAMCGDVVLADTEASFALPEIAAGFAPLLALTQLAPSIPPKVLFHLAASGKPADATTLASCGGISQVVAKDELNAFSIDYARHLAQSPSTRDVKTFLAARTADSFSADATRARDQLGAILAGGASR